VKVSSGQRHLEVGRGREEAARLRGRHPVLAQSLVNLD
jgi:hypothetical protein